MKREVTQSVINVLVSTNIETAHHKYMYQSLKYLELSVLQSWTLAFYVPSLAVAALSRNLIYES